METCGTCFYLIMVGDPEEAINECHRGIPIAINGLATYPLVKNTAPGCGEWAPIIPVEPETVVTESPPAGHSEAGARTSKARGKALTR
jgi:hypothetical protein